MQILQYELQQFIHAQMAAVLVAFGIPGPVFWPYFAGVTVLAIGLPIIIKHELPQVRGLDKIMPFGRLFFTIPMAVFGGEHFASARFLAPAVPSWIPAHLFWVLLVGVAHIAAALAITVKKHAQLAALLWGIMIFLFVVLISIPRIAGNPGDRFAWAVGLRDLAFSGSALAWAGAQTKGRLADRAPRLVTLGRFFLGVPTVFFGVEHFLHPEFAPGVPLQKLTPAWVPVGSLWAYIPGVVLFAAGVSIIINKKARLAATYLGIMIFLLCLFLYLPIVVAIPSDIGNGLNYFADTLLFSGAALVLADALPNENHPRA